MTLRQQIVSTFAVPSHIVGERHPPPTREDAARERLAYYDALGIDPFRGPIRDPDAERVRYADILWRLGLNDAARIALTPLFAVGANGAGE